jgi:hypothetical protein
MKVGVVDAHGPRARGRSRRGRASRRILPILLLAAIGLLVSAFVVASSALTADAQEDPGFEPPDLTTLPPNPTQRIDLVALGDSYSSGEGTYLYDQHAGAQKCHRGPKAWPRMLEQGVEEIPTVAHEACSGAKTTNLVLSWKSNPPQVTPNSPNPALRDEAWGGAVRTLV